MHLVTSLVSKILLQKYRLLCHEIKKERSVGGEPVLDRQHRAVISVYTANTAL